MAMTTTTTSSSSSNPTTPNRAHNGMAPAAALTTVFTPTGGCVAMAIPYESIDCMPPNFSGYVSSASFYSPAICPSGMEPAANVTKVDPPVEPTETAMWCCMKSFMYVEEPDDKLNSTSRLCIFDRGPSTPTTRSLTGGKCSDTGDGELTTTAAARQTRLVHVPIQVRWAATDLVSVETHPLSPGAKITIAATTTNGAADATATATTTTGCGATPTPDTQGAAAPTGPPAGYAAGLSVGLLLLAVLLISLGLGWSTGSFREAAEAARRRGRGRGRQPRGFLRETSSMERELELEARVLESVARQPSPPAPLPIPDVLRPGYGGAHGPVELTFTAVGPVAGPRRGAVQGSGQGQGREREQQQEQEQQRNNPDIIYTPPTPRRSVQAGRVCSRGRGAAPANSARMRSAAGMSTLSPLAAGRTALERQRP